jgi:hypothetical protein
LFKITKFHTKNLKFGGIFVVNQVLKKNIVKYKKLMMYEQLVLSDGKHYMVFNNILFSKTESAKYICCRNIIDGR